MSAYYAALLTTGQPLRLPLHSRNTGLHTFAVTRDLLWLGTQIGLPVADLPIEVILPTVFVVISYFMAGLAPDAMAFSLFLAVILLNCLLTQTTGTIIGVVSPNNRVAQVCFTMAVCLDLDQFVVRTFWGPQAGVGSTRLSSNEIVSRVLDPNIKENENS